MDSMFDYYGTEFKLCIHILKVMIVSLTGGLTDYMILEYNAAHCSKIKQNTVC